MPRKTLERAVRKESARAKAKPATRSKKGGPAKLSTMQEVVQQHKREKTMRERENLAMARAAAKRKRKALAAVRDPMGVNFIPVCKGDGQGYQLESGKH